MRSDIALIYEQQKAIGYTSELIEGEDDCRSYMESIFSDWQAKNITAVLHEEGWLRGEHALDAGPPGPRARTSASPSTRRCR